MGWGPVDWVGRVLPEAKCEICVKKQFLGTSSMGWGPVDWVERVLPKAKFENKWTLFFELFDLSDLYIFEHLSLHIHFRAFKP